MCLSSWHLFDCVKCCIEKNKIHTANRIQSVSLLFLHLFFFSAQSLHWPWCSYQTNVQLITRPQHREYKSTFPFNLNLKKIHHMGLIPLFIPILWSPVCHLNTLRCPSDCAWDVNFVIKQVHREYGVGHIHFFLLSTGSTPRWDGNIIHNSAGWFPIFWACIIMYSSLVIMWMDTEALYLSYCMAIWIKPVCYVKAVYSTKGWSMSPSELAIVLYNWAWSTLTRTGIRVR